MEDKHHDHIVLRVLSVGRLWDCMLTLHLLPERWSEFGGEVILTEVTLHQMQSSVEVTFCQTQYHSIQPLLRYATLWWCVHVKQRSKKNFSVRLC